MDETAEEEPNAGGLSGNALGAVFMLFSALGFTAYTVLSKTLTERLDERERDLQVRNWLHSWLLLPDETLKWSTSEIEISKFIRNNSAELQRALCFMG